MNGPRIDSGVHAKAPVRPIRRLGLRGVTGAVGRARDFTESTLSEWGWSFSDWSDPDAVERAEDILLVVSELVANAMTHGGGVRELALMAEDDALVVGVTDGTPDEPVVLPGGDPSRPGGHGLHVVDKLSEAWGTTQAAPGKTVWARFPR